MRGGSNGPKPRGCGFAHHAAGMPMVAGPAHAPAGSTDAAPPPGSREGSAAPPACWRGDRDHPRLRKPMREIARSRDCGDGGNGALVEGKARLHGRSTSKEGIAEPEPEYRRAWAAVRLTLTTRTSLTAARAAPHGGEMRGMQQSLVDDVQRGNWCWVESSPRPTARASRGHMRRFRMRPRTPARRPGQASAARFPGRRRR